jgi:hypothetical protein
MSKKKELLEQLKQVSKEHKFKKSVIEKMLNDFDKIPSTNENVVKKLELKETIEKALKEKEGLEKKYDKITEEIKWQK